MKHYSIAGVTVELEESAYNLLDRYVKDVRQFGINHRIPKEVINDIEYSIAEKLSTASQPITLQTVENISSQLGQPKDIFYDHLILQPKQSLSVLPQLLYWSTTPMIFGVCAYLADIYKRNVGVVRTIAIIMLLIPGLNVLGMILYVIIAALIPQKWFLKEIKEYQSRVNKLAENGYDTSFLPSKPRDGILQKVDKGTLVVVKIFFALIIIGVGLVAALGLGVVSFLPLQHPWQLGGFISQPNAAIIMGGAIAWVLLILVAMGLLAKRQLFHPLFNSFLLILAFGSPFLLAGIGVDTVAKLDSYTHTVSQSHEFGKDVYALTISEFDKSFFVGMTPIQNRIEVQTGNENSIREEYVFLAHNTSIIEEIKNSITRSHPTSGSGAIERIAPRSSEFKDLSYFPLYFKKIIITVRPDQKLDIFNKNYYQTVFLSTNGSINYRSTCWHIMVEKGNIACADEFEYNNLSSSLTDEENRN